MVYEEIAPFLSFSLTFNLVMWRAHLREISSDTFFKKVLDNFQVDKSINDYLSMLTKQNHCVQR